MADFAARAADGEARTAVSFPNCDSGDFSLTTYESVNNLSHRQPVLLLIYFAYMNVQSLRMP